MLIFIILIVTILCMIFFMVKISDRGDAVAFACKDLEPLSSPEQSSVSKHRPKQNSTSASKLDQELSNILDATDQIINHSNRLIKTYNNLQQQWDALPDELDPDNKFSQMVTETNISRQLKETFEQIKKQNKECRYWIEQIERLHKTSKLPTAIIERHNTITTVHNYLIGIIVDNWDEERFGRKLAADPELGYDPFDPDYKMDLSWNEICSKYELIITQNDRIQQLFQDVPLKFNQISRQRQLAVKSNDKEELKYLTNTTLNTINSTIDATYELELLIPRCHHLRRVISITQSSASNKKAEMLTQLDGIIRFAEERLEDLKNFNCDARSKFMELSHDEEDKLAEEEEIDVEAIRSNIQWELLIGQANVITDKIKALTKESDRLYKMVEDITTMSDDYNKNKDTLRYAIEGVIDISQRVSDLYNEGVEVEQSFYNLAKEQNIENDDLPDNVSNAISNITQLTKTVEKLSSRANEVSKLMPEGDTEEKILDIDNFGEKSLEDKQNNITPLNDTSDQDGFDPNSPILQEQDTSTYKIDLNESSTDQDEQINASQASTGKLNSINETSANSDQGITSVNEDSSELNSSNKQSDQSIDQNELQKSNQSNDDLTHSPQQTNQTEQRDQQEAAITTQQPAINLQQVEQSALNEFQTAKAKQAAQATDEQIMALCNAITKLQQQIEALTTQQMQTNMQVRAQANNTLAMTMQLEQINTQLATLSQSLTAPAAPETTAPASQ